MIEAGREIELFGKLYTFACMPGTPDIVFGMTGRAGTVYKLTTPEGEAWALKTFNPAHCNPGQVRLAKELETRADLSGLQVCRRKVLTPQDHRQLLREAPEMVYSVLMPWVDGQTWTELIFARQNVTPAMSLKLAQCLAEILSHLEQESIAHCDMAGGNLIIEDWSEESAVLSLVDVEDIYARNMQRPALIPGGSPGYGPGKIQESLWCAEADRLSTAILLSEILCWCDPDIREQSEAESYFADYEVQADCERYRGLLASLARLWGSPVASLLERAWEARSLTECPNLGEWSLLIPDKPPAAPVTVMICRPTPEVLAEATAASERVQTEGLVDKAREHMANGRNEIAKEVLQSALATLPHDNVLTIEVERLIKVCENPTQHEQLRCETNFEVIGPPEATPSEAPEHGGWVSLFEIQGTAIVGAAALCCFSLLLPLTQVSNPLTKVLAWVGLLGLFVVWTAGFALATLLFFRRAPAMKVVAPLLVASGAVIALLMVSRLDKFKDLLTVFA